MSVDYTISVAGQAYGSKTVWQLTYTPDTPSITVAHSTRPEATSYPAGQQIFAKDTSGNLYIASNIANSQVIRKYDSSLTLDTTWATNGVLTAGTSASSTNYIYGIKINSAGLLYVIRLDANTGKQLYCYNPDGSLRWSADYSAYRSWNLDIIRAIDIATDGSIFLNGTYDDPLQLNSNGNIIDALYPLPTNSSNAYLWIDSINQLVYFTATVGGSYLKLIQYSIGSGTVAPVKNWEVSFSALDHIMDMLFHSNGRTYLCGYKYNNQATHHVVEIDINDGSTLHHWGSPGNELMKGISELPNNEIVAVGAKDEAQSDYNLWILDEDLVEQTGSAITGSAGLSCCRAEASSVSTSPPSNATFSKRLVAIGGNEFWYETSAGTMEKLSAAGNDISTFSPVSIFEAYQKVFVINETTLKVADFGNVKISTANLGANPPDFHTVLTGGTSGAKMVVDYITSLSGACTIYGSKTTGDTFVSGETVTGTDDDGNAISFTLNINETLGPFWYNWTVFGDDASYGALPAKATIGCLYRGRTVLAGNARYPYQWYMSKQANPWNFVYASNNAQSAVSGGDSDAGEIGDIITALIPYKDDYLVIGCAGSIWLLSGDPVNGGTLSEFSLVTGIFGPKSFCWDNEDNLYFWGINGLYKATVPGNAVCLTKDPLPNIVADEGLNRDTHKITLAYDKIRSGILVCITTLADGSNSNYFYDLASEGFYPESYPDECGVFSIFNYDAEDPDYRKMILGCNDGYLRYFNNAKKDDDAGASGDTAIDSYFSVGPFQLGSTPEQEGRLTGLILVSAGGAANGTQSDSDDINCELFLARSAGETIEKLTATSRTPNFSKTISAPGRGRGNQLRRKLRGVYAGVRLGNNAASETWGFEQLIINSVKAGRLK